MNFIVKKSKSISGVLRVPGDKSISHRAIIFGSLAKGISTVRGFLQGADSLATIKAFQDMGVRIENNFEEVVIHGVGINGLKPANKALNLGNSGTAMRLLSGVLAGQKFKSKLIGDESLSSRPMNRIITPLTKMSAKISSNNGTAPLEITGSQLKAIEYKMPIASAQLKSAILLAGIYAKGKTCVIEPVKTRDHTERMLQGFGYPISIENNRICLNGDMKLNSCEIDVPADISSAAFFMVAATITKNSQLTLNHVGINPTRTGIIDILRLMGANIKLQNQILVGGEPVADIVVKSAPLHGVTIPSHLVPLAIDEFPVIFIAAAFAKGTTILTDAKELKVKESDRISSMVNGLKTLGVDARATEDGAIIKGGAIINGGTVESYNDHRISMAFAVCGLIAANPIEIKDCVNVNTSFPNFVKLAQKVGFNIKIGR